jgi:hypothetical protein
VGTSTNTLSTDVPRDFPREVSFLSRPLQRSSLYTALAILCLNIVDALFTLRHLAHGAEEMNPLMDQLLQLGPLPFVIGKHCLASLGILGILAFDHTRAARLALRWVLLPVYLCVAIYQVILFLVI